MIDLVFAMSNPRFSTLPVINNLKPAFAASLVVALLMAAASLAGLVRPVDVYPDEISRQSFFANDILNLAIGLPILLGSLWFARRGSLVGLLFWPGALLFVVYNYLAYLFSASLSLVYPIYLTITTLGIYTIIGLIAGIDSLKVKERLGGAVPERLAGGVIAALGILFVLRAIAVLVGASLNQTPLPETELGVTIADFMLVPAWVVGGVALWRRQRLGYVAGVGLLFQGSMLFIGLIVFLILHPLLSKAPFNLVDIIVVFVMGLICFVPFAMFLRGVIRTQNQ